MKILTFNLKEHKTGKIKMHRLGRERTPRQDELGLIPEEKQQIWSDMATPMSENKWHNLASAKLDI